MISIIVPIYNVEEFIAECLQSVVAQTYRDYELILVDDCGTDGSMSVAARFASHPALEGKMRILRHDHNRGLSAARNTGTAAAKGKYILFLDSDDILAPDCLQLLVEKAESTNAEIVVGNIQILNSKKLEGFRLKPSVIEANASLSPFHLYLTDHFYMMAWNKLVRRDFLEKHDIKFVEGLIHEDCAWSFTVACVVKSISFVCQGTYSYRVRSNSIQTDRDFSKHFAAYCSLLRYYVQEAFHRHKEKDPVFQTWLEIQKALYFGFTESQGSKEQLKEMYRIIRETMPHYELTRKYIHYSLPFPLGYMAYKKWRGLAVC